MTFGDITELHPMDVDAFNTSLEELHIGLSIAWVTEGGVADSIFSCSIVTENAKSFVDGGIHTLFFISPNGFYVAPSKT